MVWPFDVARIDLCYYSSDCTQAARISCTTDTQLLAFVLVAAARPR